MWPEVPRRPGAPCGDLRPCSAGWRGLPRPEDPSRQLLSTDWALRSPGTDLRGQACLGTGPGVGSQFRKGNRVRTPARPENLEQPSCRGMVLLASWDVKSQARVPRPEAPSELGCAGRERRVGAPHHREPFAPPGRAPTTSQSSRPRAWHHLPEAGYPRPDGGENQRPTRDA
ncbi:unnamed protein product [Rangifer tarandus platyrhynchus]|uniref:Uncharacterized protein n=1 Tax=Rangifer tarandus platyrhynchus TaxID=3082113 RepID=A0AC59Y246_RANTA